MGILGPKTPVYKGIMSRITLEKACTALAIPSLSLCA